MKAEDIARKARRTIGNFCIEECRSYCCRKGYLVLTEQQKKLVAGDREVKFLPDSLYSMPLSPRCPQLEEGFTCRIHKSRARPQACKDFPIFIIGSNVLLSRRCLAVKEGLLFPYAKMLELLGYRIIESGDDAVSELGNCTGLFPVDGKGGRSVDA